MKDKGEKIKESDWCLCGCQGYKCGLRLCDNYCYALGQAKLQDELRSKLLFMPGTI